MRFTEPREHELDGKTYFVRDVYVPDDRKRTGERLLRCEYKVRRGSADVWHPTYEGALFSDMEPYEKAVA